MQLNHSRTVFVIAGPTAVGKTAVAIALAKQLRTSIISADSRQCYQEMTIGTAKPSIAELNEVKHYFINEFPVTRSLSAADYEMLALGYANEIFRENNNAVMCGGTGLYIKAFCDGLDEMPPIDDNITRQVNEEYTTNGLNWLQETIHGEDPLFYARAEIHNPARLIRALIFKRSTGRSITEFQNNDKKERDFHIIKIALELPREELYNRINLRVDKMMEEGLLNEVRTLYSLKDLKNLQTVGYSELFDHLEGKCTLAEAVDKIKQHTRNYAKRQMTWFKKDKEFAWFAANDPQIIEKIIALK